MTELQWGVPTLLSGQYHSFSATLYITVLICDITSACTIFLVISYNSVLVFCQVLYIGIVNFSGCFVDTSVFILNWYFVINLTSILLEDVACGSVNLMMFSSALTVWFSFLYYTVIATLR